MSEQNPTGDLLPVIAPVVHRLTALAMTEGEFRDQLRCLGEAIVKVATTKLKTELIPASAPTRSEQLVASESTASAQVAVVRSSTIRPENKRHHSRPIPLTDTDLPMIEGSFRLRAEAARCAGEYQRHTSNGEGNRFAINQRYREIVEDSKKIECYLWVIDPNYPKHLTPAGCDSLSDCYNALADGVALIVEILKENGHHRHFLKNAAQLLAEAHSALVGATTQMYGPADNEACVLFDWLHEVAHRERFVINMFMGTGNQIDPSEAPMLVNRIASLRTQVQAAHERQQRNQTRLDCLQSALRNIGSRASAH
jgi:hypothetical protein